MSQGKAVWSLVALAVCVLLLIIACDDDKPTEPTPPDEPANYMFYLNDGVYPEQYYRYHCEEAVVDTVTIPYTSYDGLAVAADGSLLYLSNEYRTVVVDADSFKVVAELEIDSRNGASVSCDNQYVALMGGDISILSTSDYSPIFHDTDNVYSGVFAADSRSFCCISTAGYIYQVDLSNGSFDVTRRYITEERIRRIVLTPSQDRWFLYLGNTNYSGSFEVYDVDADSIIFCDSIAPCTGDMEITADGEYVFYSTGSNFDGPEAPSSFTVFDVEANDILEEIGTGEFAEAIPGVLPIGPLAITPDETKLLAVQAPTGGAEFVVFDIRTMEIERHIQLGDQTIIHDVACQSGR